MPTGLRVTERPPTKKRMRVFVKGDRVCQRQYGTGTIVDTDVWHTVIDFDDHGLRKFATQLVELQQTSVPPPPRRPVSRPRRRGAARTR